MKGEFEFPRSQVKMNRGLLYDTVSKQMEGCCPPTGLGKWNAAKF